MSVTYLLKNFRTDFSKILDIIIETEVNYFPILHIPSIQLFHVDAYKKYFFAGKPS